MKVGVWRLRNASLQYTHYLNPELGLEIAGRRFEFLAYSGSGVSFTLIRKSARLTVLRSCGNIPSGLFPLSGTQIWVMSTRKRSEIVWETSVE